MKVWLITVGEPLPIGGADDRLLRTGLLAETLAAGGHDVAWWTSAFDHLRKRHHVQRDTQIDVGPRYQIRLLHAPRYGTNVSLRRILNHRGIAGKFRRLAPNVPPPDVILCSLPLLELCREATEYARQRRIPVVLDVRDMWPDAIVELAPRWIRPLIRPLFRRSRRSVIHSCQSATAITGITDGLIGWALDYADRERTALDRPFPMGYREKKPHERDLVEAQKFWRRYGISTESGEFVVCFFGTIGRHFEIETIVHAARILSQSSRRVRFVLCGTGPQIEKWRRLAADCENVLLTGWVNAAKIWTLMRMSSAGLAPYVSTRDFRLSIPNKPIEYLSAGLPIISSLQGVLADLLADHRCGITYANGDAEQLSRAVIECYDNKERLESMSTHAGRLFRRRFVAETVYREMQDYLAQIVGSDILRPAA